MPTTEPAVWVAEVDGMRWVSKDGPVEHPSERFESPHGAAIFEWYVSLRAECSAVFYLDCKNPRDFLGRQFPATFRCTDGGGVAVVMSMAIESVEVMPRGTLRFADQLPPDRPEYDVTLKAVMVR